ncbi:hypothetical protein [Alkalicoccus daliensis]|uniref:Uncharacterized protein n=1 Tax=Alkalicoccus daliensis TaxID=745820 RepID=A0A1H0CYM9_9BACI|nr:hypothetical protein [Alkalicoccus daliensis]SDN62896.1 hypothetical protein SAMN04488053_102276 [Alkalicoccus daliensis]
MTNSNKSKSMGILEAMGKSPWRYSYSALLSVVTMLFMDIVYSMASPNGLFGLIVIAVAVFLINYAYVVNRKSNRE